LGIHITHQEWPMPSFEHKTYNGCRASPGALGKEKGERGGHAGRGPDVSGPGRRGPLLS